MHDNATIDLFIRFGLAGLLGLLVGIEREMSAAENPHTGARDFIMFALAGATSAFAAGLYGNSWIVVAGFGGVLALVVSGYWHAVSQQGASQQGERDAGITTEIAALLTYLVGVVVANGEMVLGIALAILLLAILSQKQHVRRFSSSVQRYEVDAALKFLIISFIVLPILPNVSLDTYFTLPFGTVTSVDAGEGIVTLKPVAGFELVEGDRVDVYLEDTGHIGRLRVDFAGAQVLTGRIERIGEAPTLSPGAMIRAPLGVRAITVMLSALRPYKIWLIVVLVSFVSLIGYILIKLLGTDAGIGLTGVIGGLASSTVTTLSFAKRSKEVPAWSRTFAVAVILASSVMFPRLLLQIGIVNHALMKNTAVPILVMGATGLLMAAFFFLVRNEKTDSTEGQEMKFSNPFSLKSAMTFGLVFSVILMITRLAIEYLGDVWLPAVAIVSGLTDADAIAFSLSDAQQAGMISLDWASFNLVLGALSNTFMKLFLVLTLGHRTLFKHLLLSFAVIGVSGITTMLLYYDLSAIRELGS